MFFFLVDLDLTLCCSGCPPRGLREDRESQCRLSLVLLVVLCLCVVVVDWNATQWFVPILSYPILLVSGLCDEAAGAKKCATRPAGGPAVARQCLSAFVVLP